jgi:hypothetical protein
MKNKESLIGALSSFLGSQNFEAKLQFISKFKGLSFLRTRILDQTNSNRLLRKVLILTNDLVVNDDSIICEDPQHVRNFFAEDQ